MVNPNIQAPIPLAGRGLVNHANGDYASGEYRRLMDVEINDQGHLISRRPIKPTTGTTTQSYNAVPFNNPMGFIGYHDKWAMVADQDGIWGVSTYPFTARIKHWDHAAMPPGGYAPTPHHRPEAFHRYNNINYVITYKTYDDGSTDGVEFHIYKMEAFNPQPQANAFASYTDMGAAAKIRNRPRFIASVVHKDRLWFAVDDTVYFSKATDLAVFTVPDGGFFKFPGDKISDIIGHKDSIYVICESSVYLITYTSDPNVDATVRKCSSMVGGDSACVYEDVVYFVKNNEVFAISGTSVTKMYDLELTSFIDPSYEMIGTTGYGDPLAAFTKMVAFGDYLVFIRRVRHFYKDGSITSGLASSPWAYFSINNVYDLNSSYPPDLFPGLVFLNMKSGAMHGVMFSDKLEEPDRWKQAWPCDIFLNPVEYANDSYLYILTNFYTGLKYNTPYISGKGEAYAMRYSFGNLYSESPAKDIALNHTTGVSAEVNYYPEIEINSFTPDGSEYFIKKFRTLLIMGKLPYYGCRISYAYDNQPFSTPRALDQTALIDNANARAPFPMRLPLNQRARSITIKLDMDPTAALSTKQDISITDMRILWSYSKRAPATDTKG